MLAACVCASGMVLGAALSNAGTGVAPAGTVADISSATWTPVSTLTNAFTAESGSMDLGSIVIDNNKRAGYKIAITSFRLGKLRLTGVDTARAGETGHEIAYTISSAVPASDAGTASGQSPDPLVFSDQSLSSELSRSVNVPLNATESAKYDLSISYGANNMLFAGNFSDTITITYVDL